MYSDVTTLHNTLDSYTIRRRKTFALFTWKIFFRYHVRIKRRNGLECVHCALNCKRAYAIHTIHNG